MKVRDLLNLVHKLSLILENYQDYSVDEMLDDIYRQTSSSIDIQKDEISHEVKESKLFSAENIISNLREMEYGGRTNYLKSHKYTNAELMGIVDYLQIKVKANFKKAELIEVIANYDFLNDLSYKDEKVLKAENVVDKVETDDLMAEAVVKIPEMNQDEIITYLEPFRKYEILEIARRLNVKIAKSNTRDNVILLIAKHFGYKDINRRILERPRRGI